MGVIPAETAIPASWPGETKISHAALLMGSRIVRRLLRLAFVLAAARALGPQRFGVYVLLLAIVEMVALASGSGFFDYLAREAAKDVRLGWGLCSQLALLRLGYGAALGVAAVGILRLLAYPRLVLVAAAWLFLTLIPRGLSETVQGILLGIQRYGSLLAVDFALGLTLVTGGCLLLLRAGGLRAIIATELAGATAAGLVALVFFLRFRPAERSGLPWSQLVRRTVVFNFYPLLSNLYDRLDVVLLSKLAGDYATGIYSAAYRATGLLQLIPYGVLYSLLPAVSRDTWGRAEKQRLERTLGLLLSAALAAVLATVVFAAPAVRLLLGARYAESVPAVKILIWALIPMYINYALNISLLATGHEKVFLVTTSVCLATNFIANLIFIPMFSWRAAAAITIVTELVLLLQNVRWIRRAIGTVPTPYGASRTSLVFLALLAIALAGERLAFPLLLGTSCLVVFVAYLYRSGMMTEFGHVWRPGQKAPA